MSLATEDYIAIQQLYARYAFNVDLHELEPWLSNWTEDGALVTTAGKSVRGQEERRALFESNMRNPDETGYHWVSNLVIEPTEYGASGRCYLMHLFAPDGPAKLRYAFYYQDELVKQDGRWLFRLRTLHKVSADVKQTG